MADETSKTKQLWGRLEHSVLKGDGRDIGCGPDPVFPHVMPFDLEQGDANNIGRHINKQFDFVYSSHCLEHMMDPVSAVTAWWSLVKPGGVLFVIVPDEDIYEQGFWPSRFNPDHNWSPVSVNLLDLMHDLPEGELVDIRLQDNGYQRWLMSNGSRPGSVIYAVRRYLSKLSYLLLRAVGLNRSKLKNQLFYLIDQTTHKDVLARYNVLYVSALVGSAAA